MQICFSLYKLYAKLYGYSTFCTAPFGFCALSNGPVNFQAQVVLIFCLILPRFGVIAIIATFQPVPYPPPPHPTPQI